jgi:VWFA-related protein
MALTKLSLCLAVLLLQAAISAAQDSPQPQEQQPTFRAQSNLVLTPALVKDKRGAIVYGLQAKDFIIEDDGVEQSVRLDDAPTPAPISLVVVIQLGASAPVELPRIRTLGILLDPILSQSRNRTAIVTFDSAVELTRGFTTNGALIASDLKELRSGDYGAAILDAVGYSVALLKQEPKERQRILLLVSETRDHGSHVVTFEDTVQAITDSNTLVYSLAFSPTVSNVLDTMRGSREKQPRSEALGCGLLLPPLRCMAVQAMRKNTPKTIASMTGGEYELFKSHAGFESRMTEFSNHLHNRYLLSFEPKDPHPGLHRVRVRLRESAEVSILARERYWAGAPESDH